MGNKSGHKQTQWVNPASWKDGYRDAQRTFLRDNRKTSLTRLKKMGVLDLPRSSCILDFGCGDGNLIRLLQDEGFRNVTGIEPDRTLLYDTDLTGKVIVGSAPELPFCGETFDAIISNAVLHHLPDEAALIASVKDFFRILRDGGLFCYTEPANTLARSILTPLLLSPVGLLTDFSRKKRLMILSEIETMNRWIRIERRFPDLITAQAGFRITHLERHALKTFLRAAKVR